MGNLGLIRNRRLAVVVRCIMSLAIAVILTGLAQAQSTIDDAAKPTSCGVSIKACAVPLARQDFYDVAGTLLDVKLNSDTKLCRDQIANVVLFARWHDDLAERARHRHSCPFRRKQLVSSRVQKRRRV